MRSSTLALSALLLSAAVAQPHHRHQHRHAHPRAAPVEQVAKRQDGPVIISEYIEVTETILLAATVFVDESGSTLGPVKTGTQRSTATGKPVTKYSPGIFHEPAPTPKPKPSPSPSPSPSPEPVVEEPEPVVQVPPPPPPPPPAPEPTPEPIPEPVPEPIPEPVVQPQPVVEEPQPQVQQAPPPPPPVQPVAQVVDTTPITPPTSGGSTGSVTGDCSSPFSCSGEITFYQAGLGACGETHDGLSESVVALPHGMMGTQSNGNPFCGRKVQIRKNGMMVEAEVVDKCMGCVGQDLDLSEKAFAALGIDQGVGRTTAEWNFIS